LAYACTSLWPGACMRWRRGSRRAPCCRSLPPCR
jgi:hypothetical protein